MEEGLTINGLRYSGACPFPQIPIPLRFFDVPSTPLPVSYHNISNAQAIVQVSRQ